MRGLAHDSSVIMNKVNNLTKETPESQPVHSAIEGHSQKALPMTQKVGPHPTAKLPVPQSQTSQPPAHKNKMCYKPSSSRSAATADPRTDRHTGTLSGPQ